MQVGLYWHSVIQAGISFIRLTDIFNKTTIIYEGGLVWHGKHSLWDRSCKWFLAATTVTRPHCLRPLDLGFYSPVITGSCCNVRLLVANMFSTHWQKSCRVALRASRWPHQSPLSHREPVTQKQTQTKQSLLVARQGDAWLDFDFKLFD